VPTKVEAPALRKREKPWILLVDDEPRNIQLAGRILSQQGYDISFAQSGGEALEIISGELPDLIILDIMMPEMDGFEVSRRIRSEYPKSEVPIIFLSARTDTEGLLESFKAGGVDFISKPFHPEEFIARVGVHIELQQAKKRLDEEIAFRERLFTIIAHDLRSPFNSIIGTLDVLKHNSDSLTEEEKEEFITILYNAGHQELMMMDNLLQWARSQFKGVKRNTRSVDLHEIAKRVSMELTHMAEHKRIDLSQKIPPGTFAWADHNMVQIILRNLVSNALKFTPRDGKITMYADAGENETRVFVSDSGRGVADTESLFELGNYRTTPGTEYEKGSGLGLHLCRDFVHANSGRLWLEDTGESGSTFGFSLPARDPGADTPS
jgi:two-component system sensor histidine kinase/response regulator